MCIFSGILCTKQLLNVHKMSGNDNFPTTETMCSLKKLWHDVLTILLTRKHELLEHFPCGNTCSHKVFACVCVWVCVTGGVWGSNQEKLKNIPAIAIACLCQSHQSRSAAITNVPSFFFIPVAIATKKKKKMGKPPSPLTSHIHAYTIQYHVRF